MRIIAGAWRGRKLAAPPGPATRPTADRVRQALFDSLTHASWAKREGGRALLEGARVLDAFAGSGALGLEALSRGAAHATFFERDGSALAALRANIAACRAVAIATVLAIDAAAPPSAAEPCDLVFLDPPYRLGLIARTLDALHGRGWLTSDALLVMETAVDEPAPVGPALLERTHGAARITAARWQGRPGPRAADAPPPTPGCRAPPTGTPRQN